jgi:hypothetical protein
MSDDFDAMTAMLLAGPATRSRADIARWLNLHEPWLRDLKLRSEVGGIPWIFYQDNGKRAVAKISQLFGEDIFVEVASRGRHNLGINLHHASGKKASRLMVHSAIRKSTRDLLELIERQHNQLV